MEVSGVMSDKYEFLEDETVHQFLGRVARTEAEKQATSAERQLSLFSQTESVPEDEKGRKE